MTRILSILTILWIYLLCSCGDDSYVNTTPSKLEQYVFVTADTYSGDINTFFDPIDSLFLEPGQSVKFYAGYSIDGHISTNDSLSKYYSSLLWSLDSSYFNINVFRYTFMEPGHKYGFLQTVDLFGDTLKTPFEVFINTPQSIRLSFPYDGYNQAEPEENQGLPLRWDVQGIDEWEEATCNIFISYDADSVWQRRIGSTDCRNQVTLKGSLVQEIVNTSDTPVDLTDSSITLYWAVRLDVKSASGRSRSDSTKIFRFSTKILDDQYSTIKIPIIYSNYRDKGILNTEIVILDSRNDTLQVLHNDARNATISAKIKPQSGIKIILKEQNRKEYQGSTITLDVPANTVVITDTVRFQDKTPPQLAPFVHAYHKGEPVTFVLYDDGSGINPNKIKVLLNSDTLSYEFALPMLQFPVSCNMYCALQIQGEDYAHNAVSNITWNVKESRDSIFIAGPFYKEDP